MRLTDNQTKRAIKGMITKFSDNFAPRDLESIYGKNEDLSLEEFLSKEYPTYSLKECYRELNNLLLEKHLQNTAPENKGAIKFHGMRIEWTD